MTTSLTQYDWPAIGAHLDAHGWAMLPGALASDECAALSGLYDEPSNFRSRVIMQRHGFGRGEYQYFAYPLPATIAELRSALYLPLAPIANRWNQAMGIDARFPDQHDALLARCHSAGQTRPTPLLLRYGVDDFNAVHHRPVAGTRGTYRVNLRHGVGRIRRGQRFTTGIIFHDAT